MTKTLKERIASAPEMMEVIREQQRLLAHAMAGLEVIKHASHYEDTNGLAEKTLTELKKAMEN